MSEYLGGFQQVLISPALDAVEGLPDDKYFPLGNTIRLQECIEDKQINKTYLSRRPKTSKKIAQASQRQHMQT